MSIHLGRRSSVEGWVSFESDQRLTRTKKRLHEKCLPCMSALWEQLAGTPEKVTLSEALECWKVAVLFDERDDCLTWLDTFDRLNPDEEVYGKFGKGAGGHETYAVIFHTESVERRDELMLLADPICREHPCQARPFYSRGCGIPYEQLLGPWRKWREESPIAHPERIGQIKAYLRRSLFRA